MREEDGGERREEERVREIGKMGEGVVAGVLPRLYMIVKGKWNDCLWHKHTPRWMFSSCVCVVTATNTFWQEE